ncbi:MAG: hypothetical protein CM1200mP35_07450 [Chloroflexota bacterium]|nr:MAG: hypothetical protein CM1200mP35_07450 [Chloroflexota bacterium]
MIYPSINDSPTIYNDYLGIGGRWLDVDLAAPHLGSG